MLILILSNRSTLMKFQILPVLGDSLAASRILTTITLFVNEYGLYSVMVIFPLKSQVASQP